MFCFVLVSFHFFLTPCLLFLYKTSWNVFGHHHVAFSKWVALTHGKPEKREIKENLPQPPYLSALTFLWMPPTG